MPKNVVDHTIHRILQTVIPEHKKLIKTNRTNQISPFGYFPLQQGLSTIVEAILLADVPDGAMYYATDLLEIREKVNGVWVTGIVSGGISAGALFDHYATNGNTSTTETDLYSDTVLANTLAADGDKLTADYTCVVDIVASSTERVKTYFGGQSVFIAATVLKFIRWQICKNTNRVGV